MGKRALAFGILAVALYTVAAFFNWRAHWAVNAIYPGGAWVRYIASPWAYILQVLTIGLGVLATLICLVNIYVDSQGTTR